MDAAQSALSAVLTRAADAVRPTGANAALPSVGRLGGSGGGGEGLVARFKRFSADLLRDPAAQKSALQLTLSIVSAALSVWVMNYYVNKMLARADPDAEGAEAGVAAGRRGVIAERLARAGVSAATLPPREAALLSRVVCPADVEEGFDAIGGLDSAIATVQERVLAPLQQPELFARSRLLSRPTGVLLYGPPGTGKTLLAKAIAKASGALFFSVTPAALLSKYYGESSQRVEALFSLARRLAPSIIFIDEMDGMLSRRSHDSTSGEADLTTKTTLLSCWDGLQAGGAVGAPGGGGGGAAAAAPAADGSRSRGPPGWVMVIGATNLPSLLDDAALRRMPCRIAVPLPDESGRAGILRVLLRGEHTTATHSVTADTVAAGASVAGGRSGGFITFLRIAEDSSGPVAAAAMEEAVAAVAGVTAGFSGADLAELVRAAVYRPVREAIAERATMPIDVIDAAGQALPTGPPRPVGPIDLLSAAAAMVDSRASGWRHPPPR